jgi:hypothetical protein
VQPTNSCGLIAIASYTTQEINFPSEVKSRNKNHTFDAFEPTDNLLPLDSKIETGIIFMDSKNRLSFRINNVRLVSSSRLSMTGFNKQGIDEAYFYNRI